MAYGTIDPVAPVVERPRYLEWGPIFAGALAAAAISFLLLTFGSTVGLSLTSAWADRGISLVAIAWAVAWWTVIVEIGSFSAGGYLAGRLRTRWSEPSVHETQFRDNVHGFLVWAVGILFGAAVLAMTGGAILKTAGQSAATVAAAAAPALAQNDYVVDQLLRPAVSTSAPATPANTSAASPAPSTTPDVSATPNEPSGTIGVTPPPTPPLATQAAAPAPTTEPANAAGNDDNLRAEATRIIAASIKNQELSASDNDYLTNVIASRTGLSQSEAQERVNSAMTQARDLEIEARQTAEQARKATVIGGFITAASLLVSLVAACLAASVGGRHRDENLSPAFFGHARFW